MQIYLYKLRIFTYKDGKFLNLKINFKDEDKNTCQVSIKDSYLLLTSSLAKLAKQFNQEDKGMFPYSFPKSNNLKYYGAVPDYKYFKHVSLERYNEYKSSFLDNWSLKTEALEYCASDCILLYNVLKEFSLIILTKLTSSEALITYFKVELGLEITNSSPL